MNRRAQIGHIDSSCLIYQSASLKDSPYRVFLQEINLQFHVRRHVEMPHIEETTMRLPHVFAWLLIVRLHVQTLNLHRMPVFASLFIRHLPQRKFR